MQPLKIERSVTVAATPQRVWQALTEPKQFSKWFGHEIQFAKLEVGAPIDFFGEGEGSIAIIEPTTRFAFYWPAETGYDVQTLVTFVLEEVTEGTRITVTEAGLEALPEEVRQPRFDSNAEGWTIQMQNIADYLRTMQDE